MDFTQVLENVMRVFGALIACGILWLIPQVNKWLSEKIGEEKAQKLSRLVSELVSAAEQMYKIDDPTGEIRKQYVEEQLQALGYEVTEYINSLIESEVLNINNWINK